MKDRKAPNQIGSRTSVELEYRRIRGNPGPGLLKEDASVTTHPSGLSGHVLM